MFGQQVSPRERRTILLGLGVVLFGLGSALVALPFARRWQAREAVIAGEQERLGRLRGLIAAEAQMQDAIRARESAAETGTQRLLSGRTPALAASALQSLIQDFADRSQVTVSRLDVTGAPETSLGPLPVIPATVSAVGDIYGITELLSLLQHGPLLLEISEFSVRPNPALRGELLQLTVTLRSAYFGS